MGAPKANERIIKAGMWDKMQFLFRNYYDRMVHAVLYFNGQLDFAALCHAYSYAAEKVPILRSSFVSNPIKPYWRVNKAFDSTEFVTLVETDAPESTIEGFITGNIEAGAKYQLRVAVVRSGKTDAMCFLMNHMCMDGMDTKLLISCIGKAYTEYLQKGQITVEFKSGDRSHFQIYDGFNKDEKRKALGLYRNISEVKDKTKFPFSKRNGDSPRIVLEKVKKEEFSAVKEKSKKAGASINDVLLAAYLRCLYRITGHAADKPLSVPCMVNLRRHIKGGDSYGFSNQVGFMISTLESMGKNMSQTVMAVREQTDKAKNDKYMGLYSLPLLNLAYKVFPQALAEIAIRIGYTNPYTGMSNLGVITEKDWTFGTLKLKDAWVTGAIKKKPYMQLSVCTFKDEIIMSIAVDCNDEDEKTIIEFLKNIKEELTSFINERDNEFDKFSGYGGDTGK